MSSKASPMMIENAHLIQVYSNTRTMWRGVEWFSFSLDIKSNKALQAGKENNTVILRAIIEDCESNQVYAPWESEKVRAKFEKHCLKDHSWNAHLVPNDPYNTLHVDVHRDLFNEGDAFKVIVAAQELEGSETIVIGSSQPILVTNLALCIEEHFSDHPGIVKVDDDNFVFYSKMSGASDGLKVVISLLDENGALSSRNLPHVDIETQLVYENGIPVPIMPMKPLKLKCRKKDKGVVRSQKPTFERLNGEPLLGKGKQSTVFKFCLNEVTYHHHGHDGFKVRASIRVGDEQEVVKIHPGVLNEVITVLSKPRKVDTVDKLQEDSGVNLKLKLLTPLKEDMELVGKRKASSQDCDDDYAHHVSERSKLDIIGENEDLEKTPKVKQATSKALEANSSSHVTKRGEVGESKYPVQRDNAPSLSVPIRTILQAYKCIGKCFACHAEIENGTLCKPEYHSVVCAFADNMLPLFQDVDHSVLQSIDEELFATLFEPIMESKSFEECSKEYIANAPNEVFDTSMFTADGSVMSNDFQDLIREGNKHPANLQYREHIFKTNAACCDVKYALQPPSEKTLNGHARDLSGMSNGNFNSDEIIAGENIFASRFADQDDGTTNNSHPEAGDFLSFLDHVARGEQQCMNNM